MIANRWRTLLLNLATDLPSFPGEEYVSPDFLPQPIRGGAKAVWQALFGLEPDRAYRNYLLYQYASIVHHSALKADITAFDPRITYWPVTAPAARWAAYGRLVTTRVNGTGSLKIAAMLMANDMSGKSTITLDVSVSGTTLSTDSSSTPFSYTNGLATVVLPHWSGLSVHIQQGASGQWRIEGNLRPARSAATALATLPQLAAPLSEVFGATPRSRELQDFYKDAKTGPDRMAPVLIALGHKIAIDRGESVGT